MTTVVLGSIAVARPPIPAPPRSRRLWNEAELLAVDACERVTAWLAPAPAGTPRPWAVAAVTGSAGESEFRRQFSALCADGDRGMRPSTAPQAGLNSAAALLSIDLGAVGPNLTLSGPADALGYAVHWAGRYLATGEVELALVVAVEEGAPAVALCLTPADATTDPTTLTWEPRRPTVLEVRGAQHLDLALDGRGDVEPARPVERAVRLAEAVGALEGAALGGPP